MVVDMTHTAMKAITFFSKNAIVEMADSFKPEHMTIYRMFKNLAFHLSSQNW